MLASLASYYGRLANEASAASRDEVMYQNAIWHLSSLPQGTKAVIWTANVHAAREGDGKRPPPMGSLLAQRFGAGYAAIGGTALKGWSRMAGGETQALEMAPTGALEQQVAETAGGVAYLDSAHLREMGPVVSRLSGVFVEADWARYFDGVFIVKDEQAPSPGW
jgi:erythromycin esterase-like protein